MFRTFGSYPICKKLSVDVIKDLEMPWIIWLGSKCNDKCLYKGHSEEKLCEHGGRDWRDVTTTHGTPTGTGSQKRQENRLPGAQRQSHWLALALGLLAQEL